MTITINETFFYYWLVAILFSTIYYYKKIKTQWKKLKSETDSYGIFMMLINKFKQEASYKRLLKQIFNPINYILIYLIFCFISPILFPITILRLIIKNLFKRKTDD